MSNNQARSIGALLRRTGERDWVDFAKGAAIIMVVYYHAVLMLRAVDIDGGGGRLKIVLELFPMPLFFLIAGLYSLRIPSWTLKDTWHRRISTYLYLYGLWSIIRFIFYWIVPNAVGEVGEISAQNPLGLLAILVWPSSSLWFIYALAIYSFAVWAMKRLPVALQIAIAALVSMPFSSSLLDTDNVGWNRIGACFIFFVVGVHFSRRIVDAVSRIRWWVVPSTFAIFAAVALTIVVFRIVHVPFLVMLGQFAAVAFGITAAYYLVRLRALSFVSYLGAQSYQIYLIHLFLIVTASSILSLFFGVTSGRLIAILLPLVLAAFAIVVSLFIARVTRRFSWLYVPPRRRKRKSSPGFVKTEREVVPRTDSGDATGTRE